MRQLKVNRCRIMNCINVNMPDSQTSVYKAYAIQLAQQVITYYEKEINVI